MLSPGPTERVSGGQRASVTTGGSVILRWPSRACSRKGRLVLCRPGRAAARTPVVRSVADCGLPHPAPSCWVRQGALAVCPRCCCRDRGACRVWSGWRGVVNSVPVVMIAEVTDELSRVDGSAVCCRRAEAATLLRLPPARLVGGTRPPRRPATDQGRGGGTATPTAVAGRPGGPRDRGPRHRLRPRHRPAPRSLTPPPNGAPSAQVGTAPNSPCRRFRAPALSVARATAASGLAGGSSPWMSPAGLADDPTGQRVSRWRRALKAMPSAPSSAIPPRPSRPLSRPPAVPPAPAATPPAGVACTWVRSQSGL